MFVARCALSVVCCSLFGEYCALFDVRCLAAVVCCRVVCVVSCVGVLRVV